MTEPQAKNGAPSHRCFDVNVVIHVHDFDGDEDAAWGVVNAALTTAVLPDGCTLVMLDAEERSVSPPAGEDLYDVARKVTDEVLGEGTYAEINAGNSNPAVRRAITRANSLHQDDAIDALPPREVARMETIDLPESNARAPKRKYRMVPSEQAGYTPGLFVVQYRDPDVKRWFDIGDPKERKVARDILAGYQRGGS